MKIKVWDPVVRIFHWITAAIFFANYWLIDGGEIHRWLGYTVAGLLVVRTAWGVIGPPHARFADFFPTVTKLKAYTASVLKGKHPTYVGHNPVGAIMIIALLVMLVALSVSGWMMGLDQFWGVDWVEESHEIIATTLHVLVGIHVTAILLTDRFYGEGLLRSMITGVKDIDGIPE